MLTSDVIDYFGNKKKVAEALGMARCSISCWGEIVPMLTAYRISLITNGELQVNDPWLNGKLPASQAA